MVEALIYIHVGSGAAWLLAAGLVLHRRAASRWLAGVEIGAALSTLAAGIALWHLKHSGGMGAREHVLVVGTLCALVALGMQAGLAATASHGRLAAAALGLQAVSVITLALAAVAMTASLFMS